MPLRLRLALLFAGGAALVLGVAGVVFLLQLTRSLDASLDTGLRTRADLLAGRVSTPAGGDPLAAVGQNDQIAQLLTDRGAVLRASEAAGPVSALTPDRLRVALAGEVSFTRTINGDRSRVLAIPVTAQGRHLVAVVGTGTDISNTAEDRVRNALLIGGPPAVLAAGLAAWVLAGAALRPVERMRRQVADITEQDRDAQLAVPPTRDEIARLAVTTNGLLTRLQRALDRERGFVADAGHELRTPLAILKAELELAARPGRSHSDLVAAVTAAADETDRLSRIAEDLLLLARADQGPDFLRRRPVDLDDVVGAAMRMALQRGTRDGVTTTAAGSTGLVLLADEGQLRRALDNVLDNAVRHSPSQGVVVVTLGEQVCDGQRLVVLTVEDDGAGFPPQFLPVAFERFHRAGSARARDDGGTGLGLAIVRAIVDAHGGRVAAANRAHGGAVVSLELPQLTN